MSASALPLTDVHNRPHAIARLVTVSDLLDAPMRALASLKLTVALFAFAIFIVLIGTLAQTDADIWQVVRDYFHAWVMWVDLNLLFPKSFFPQMPHLAVPPIPMPGGMVVGTLMILNLLSAHLWRFKMQARGTRLFAGLAVVALGLILTTLVILAGHNSGGFQAQPPLSWQGMWYGLQAIFGGAWVVATYYFTTSVLLPLWRQQAAPRQMALLRLRIVVGSTVVLAALGVLLLTSFVRGWYVGDEAMRVTWQLLQGGLAGLVLLAGCVLLFQKRAGIVLLHAGIFLLMANELVVARYAVEWQVFLMEGQTSNFVRDIRTVELALIDNAGQETDEHTVIPRPILEANYRENVRRQKQGQPPVAIADPAGVLPFNVSVVEYYKNADVESRAADDKTPATAGVGLEKKIVERPAAKGTDTGGGVDLAAAYVQATDKASGKDLGTYLVSQLASEQAGADRQPERFGETVNVGDKAYHLFLRFQRKYKPYTVKLLDVRKDDYVASDTPRNYSSDIQLVDPANGVDKPVHIKMNNPLRYAGDTFYQSGYHAAGVTGGTEATTLAVVRNTGWMIPYVACMIVAIGMLAHFLITVTRFVGRRESEEIAAGDVIRAEPDSLATAQGRKTKKAARQASHTGRDWGSVSLSILAAGIFVLFVGLAARQRPPRANEMDIAAFGKLPVAHLGRIKPLDTLARNTLRAVSHRETLKLEKGKRLSATQWLLELMAGTDQAQRFPVIRIDSPEVRQIFDLPDRKGFLYSVEELQPRIKRFEDEVEVIRKLPATALSTEQRRVHELDAALREYITAPPATCRRRPSPRKSKRTRSLAGNICRRLAKRCGKPWNR
jgi:ResB-like family